MDCVLKHNLGTEASISHESLTDTILEIACLGETSKTLGIYERLLYNSDNVQYLRDKRTPSGSITLVLSFREHFGTSFPHVIHNKNK